MRSAIAWGDSLTLGTGGGASTYPAVLANLLGITVSNQGVGGETSDQIAARMIAATGNYGDTALIWAGRNNVAAGTTGNVVGDINSMLAVLTSGRYLVLSVLTGVGASAPGGSYATILTLNTALANAYGTNYFDIRRYLIDHGLTDAGITPTVQDLADIAADTVPESLRSDTIHLNAAGYTVVAQQVRLKLIALGYWHA